MIVYAAYDGVVIWEGGNALHKQGRVPKHEPLIVMREYAQNWYIIERPKNLTLPPNPSYPDYWVRRENTILKIDVPEPSPAPEPEPGWITESDVAIAILTILKWLRQ